MPCGAYTGRRVEAPGATTALVQDCDPADNAQVTLVDLLRRFVELDCAETELLDDSYNQRRGLGSLDALFRQLYLHIVQSAPHG